MLRFLTAGESHGPGLVTIIEGLPKGLAFSTDRLAQELARRRQGHGRGGRMAIERDEIEVLGGIRHGATLGSPVAVVIRNTEWPKWESVMAPEGEPTGARISRPRPGHADLPGMLKYDTDDARDILERASARETAARTVVGYMCKGMLETVGISIRSHVLSIGEIEASVDVRTTRDLEGVDEDAVRCLDAAASQQMVLAIDRAAEDKNTLGGVFEVLAFDVPAGIGSHVHYDRRLDTRLAGALMSIPAIKGVQMGDGFTVAKTPGSDAHDEIVNDDGLDRLTNRAGGVEGGMSNGQPLRVAAAMKPISTLMRPLKTVDLDTGDEAKAVRERSDVCAVPAASVVGEQMVAFVLADALSEQFGGDTVGDFKSAFEAYVSRINSRPAG